MKLLWPSIIAIEDDFIKITLYTKLALSDDTLNFLCKGPKSKLNMSLH